MCQRQRAHLSLCQIDGCSAGAGGDIKEDSGTNGASVQRRNTEIALGHKFDRILNSQDQRSKQGYMVGSDRL